MKRTNILLIIMDAVGKEALDKNLHRCKNINKLIADGAIYYENTYAQATWTLPSHVSIFSGLYPSQHGSHEVQGIIGSVDFKKLKMHVHSFVEDLGKKGYLTIGYTNNFIAGKLYGLDKGFNEFYDKEWQIMKKIDILYNKYIQYFGFVERRITKNLYNITHALIYEKDKVDKIRILLRLGWLLATLKSKPFFSAMVSTISKKRGWPIEKGDTKAVKFLAKRMRSATSPYFVFINLFNAHDPYLKKDFSFWNHIALKKLDNEYIEKSKKGYYNAIVYLDQLIGQLINSIDYRNTVIIVTADHGQAFREKQLGHGGFCFDEVLHVPLIIKFPNYFKISKPKGNYQELRNIYKLVIDILAKKYVDNGLHSDYAIVESFGSPFWKVSKKARSEIFKPQRCVYKDKLKLVKDLNSGKLYGYDIDKDPKSEKDIFDEDRFRKLVEILRNFERSQHSDLNG